MSTAIICEKIIDSVQLWPNKTALSFLGKTGREDTSFTDMLKQIRNVAYQLSINGIVKGDRIALIGENHPNWVIAYLATLFVGATAVPLDPASTIETLTTFIKDSNVKLSFVSSSLLNKFYAVCERLDHHVKAVLLSTSPQPNEIDCFSVWTQLEAPKDYKFNLTQISPEDRAVLVYTSGTTGQPKAVSLTHANIYAEATGVQRAMNFSSSEIVLGLLPLFHVYSQAVVLWIAPIIGAAVIFISELTSAEIARGLQAGKVTALVGVPRLWYLFHKKIFDEVHAQPAYLQWLFKGMLKINGLLRDLFKINAGRLFFRRVHQFFGGRLRLAISAGARFDPAIARDFYHLGFTILQGYGLTETTGAITATRFEDNRIGSVGKPLDGVEIKVHNPDNDGIGEVLVRGSMVMSGYYNNADANKEAFTSDGWFRTGDLGKFDRSNNLHILGRSKDIFKLPSGKNVFPDDIEAHYGHSPLISEISVLGIKDTASPFQNAEKLVAVVVPDFNYLKAHNIANAREALRFELDSLGRELPEYQRVHDYILHTKPLPRTTTNKVQRMALRKQLEVDEISNQQEHKAEVWEFKPADLVLMESPTGRAISSAIRQQKLEVKSLHPQMSLEFDLNLDSLARTECFAKIEKILNITLPPQEAVKVSTVAELIDLTNAKLMLAKQSAISAPSTLETDQKQEENWQQLLNVKPEEIPEAKELLKHKFLWATIAYLILKILKLVFRLEIRGANNLTKLQRPFLICPNHQSMLDPFFVCSAYPFQILMHIFHVGASEFFTGWFSQWLARQINIVPIDADLRLLGAMQASAIGLKAGKILNVYPEGQRSFDGKLTEFKKGPAILATELHLPIIPVAIEGSYNVLPRKAKWLHFAKVKVQFGEPIYPPLLPPENDVEQAYQIITDSLKASIQKMLDEMSN